MSISSNSCGDGGGGENPDRSQDDKTKSIPDLSPPTPLYNSVFPINLLGTPVSGSSLGHFTYFPSSHFIVLQSLLALPVLLHFFAPELVKKKSPA